MINDKRARVSIMGYLTNALIFAIMIFAVFAIWGFSGGFGLVVDLGKAMAKIPTWIYLAIGGAWLFGKIIGK